MSTICTTPRLRLREFTLDDTELIYQYSREETLRREIPDEVYETREEARETLEFLMAQYAGKTYPLVYGVERRSDGLLLGHVSLSEIDEGIEIGYAIGQAHQGQGYATEAVRAMTDWAKKALAASTVYGVVRQVNPGSCRVLEKAGYALQSSGLRPGFGGEYLTNVYTA
ncbi:MAG: GNAT family N-acetyltransferase [Eubacteriales bacterium]|nr:GNAT family N-acetyltransferase [Eubacteriales bacterium]